MTVTHKTFGIYIHQTIASTFAGKLFSVPTQEIIGARATNRITE